MSEEWKELEICNLPPDILVWKLRGNEQTHEVEYYSPEYQAWVKTDCFDSMEVLASLTINGIFRYRKRQQKQPSHEEIMTKWWCLGKKWFKVLAYYSNYSQEPYLCLGFGEDFQVSADWFIGRELAEIPPEASND